MIKKNLLCTYTPLMIALLAIGAVSDWPQPRSWSLPWILNPRFPKTINRYPKEPA